MAPNIHHDVEPQATMISNRLIHRTIEEYNERLEVRTFTTGSHRDSGLIGRGGHGLGSIVAEILPPPGKRILDECSHARLARSESVIQNHNLAGHNTLFQGFPPTCLYCPILGRYSG